MKRAFKILIAAIRFIATVLLWVAAAAYLYVFLLRDPQAKARTISMSVFLACVALLLWIVMFLWRQYNLYRFGKLDRRKSVSPVTTLEMAEFFSIDVAVVEDLRESRHLRLAAEKSPACGKEEQPRDNVIISGDRGIYKIVPPAILSKPNGYIRKKKNGGDWDGRH